MYKTFQEWLDTARRKTLTDNEVVRLLEDWKEERAIGIAPPAKRGKIAEWRNMVNYFIRQSSGKQLDAQPWEEASKILDEWEADKVYLLAVIRDASDKLAAARVRYEELVF